MWKKKWKGIVLVIYLSLCDRSTELLAIKWFIFEWNAITISIANGTHTTHYTWCWCCFYSRNVDAPTNYYTIKAIRTKSVFVLTICMYTQSQSVRNNNNERTNTKLRENTADDFWPILKRCLFCHFQTHTQCFVSIPHIKI